MSRDPGRAVVSMLHSLTLFFLYSVPPLAGWWLCFRLPLGRRRVSRSIVIAAPFEAVWRRLDPRGREGGWTPLYESHEAEIISDTPLAVASWRRPRHSSHVFSRVEEDCIVDEAAWRVTRVTRAARGEGALCEISLTSEGRATRVSLVYEQLVIGLLAYEISRLGLQRDLDALQDAVAGRDAESAPLLRFSGWRLAIAGVISGFAMMALILAPAFYVALGTMGVSFEALFADRAALCFVALLTVASALYLTALLLLATLVHEIGHAFALAAFGHRGVTVSLIPFGGGVALAARDYANAFEAGVVSLAGPALSALVAFAFMPDPARLSASLRSVAGGAATDYLSALFAFSGAVYAFLTLLLNIPNVLPWTGSDGALALAAIFDSRKLRLLAAKAVTALLAFVFAGIDDLLPFGLLFLALTGWNWQNSEERARGLPEAWRQLAVASVFALVVGLYAHEAATLRRVDWTLTPAAETARQADRA